MRKLLTLRRHRMRALAVVATLAAAIGAQTVAAPSASAAALDCDIRILTPTQSANGGAVYTLVEVYCDQTVSYLGGYVSLFRDGNHLDLVSEYRTNSSYVYKLNLVSCVPGDYHAQGYGFANLNGGQPDITKRVTTPTVAVSCG